MKIENQVCSLELAQKLKELGVKQESVWWWVRINDNDKWILLHGPISNKDGSSFSAFTVAELGRMLPGQFVNEFDRPLSWDTGKHEMTDGRIIWYFGYDATIPVHEADTEANARAKALIWLIENGHVEV